MAYRIERRESQLRRELPELYEEPGTLLYIGANLEMATALRDLDSVGWHITVVEAYTPHVEQLGQKPLSEWVDRIVRGDVRDLDDLPLEVSYNVAMWLHGPEHVYRDECEPVIAMLERRTTDLVILAVPWGNTDAEGPNPYAHHLSHYYEQDFAGLGYETATFPPMDQVGGNLLAWKWMS